MPLLRQDPKCEQFISQETCLEESLWCGIKTECKWESDAQHPISGVNRGACKSTTTPVTPAIPAVTVIGATATGTVVGIPAGLTQEIIDNYLKTNAKNQLANQAGPFFTLGQKYNIDPAFAVAVAMHESRKGTDSKAKDYNNYFGITVSGEGTGYREFSTPSEGIEHFYKTIRQNYVDQYSQDTPDKIACAQGSGFTDHCYVVGGRTEWIANVPKFRQNVLDMIKGVVAAIPQMPYHSDAEYKAIYGSTQEEIEAQLVTINFQGSDVRVHTKAKDAFEAVNKEITRCSISYNFWNDPSGGTFNYRTNSNDPGRLSMHAFGIAIDINPNTNPMTSNGQCITDMPICVINAFKRYGFVWGCDFSGNNKDAMHFEWRGL
jgi:D-alanyl-D-alanine carboxypeptidase/Mannosyl-glycoprotein endo-beta-N-acetylglucosaminidase